MEKNSNKKIIQEQENCPLNKCSCKNIKCIYEGWEDETWECEKCGEYFKLYYDEMR